MKNAPIIPEAALPLCTKEQLTTGREHLPGCSGVGCVICRQEMDDKIAVKTGGSTHYRKAKKMRIKRRSC